MVHFARGSHISRHYAALGLTNSSCTSSCTSSGISGRSLEAHRQEDATEQLALHCRIICSSCYQIEAAIRLTRHHYRRCQQLRDEDHSQMSDFAACVSTLRKPGQPPRPSLQHPRAHTPCSWLQLARGCCSTTRRHNCTESTYWLKR